jgi:glycerol-3-phosphate dehydrogenase
MQRDINRLKNQTFDLLVCGGGIYGAWTAYDAALRGLKVAIVDKGDWASGTSSASSKLIHGGLRYLETFDFKLVKKSLAERQMFLQVAPHRIWPLRFGIPVFKNNRLGSLRLKIGLALYDFLADKMPDDQRHRVFAKGEFINHFPHLASSELISGFTYFDGQCDDARFVLEIIDGAYLAGAVCINYCAVTNLLDKNGKIQGALLEDKLTGNQFNITAKQVIDTTGRWSETFRHKKDSFRLTKGIHLVMPNVLNKEALLLTAKSDGRVYFMIPWYGMTLLGTTDTNYQDDLEHIPVTANDIRYLLDEANQVLDKVNWTEQDVIGAFSGVRVLQQSEANNPSQISRDWVLEITPTGLISSIGGKLTSAREDASQLVDYVCEQLGINVSCQTFGRDFPWLHGIPYQQLLDTARETAKHLGIDDECADYLVKRHGKRVEDIFQICKEYPPLIQRIKPELPFIKAELTFCSQYEMVIHLDDLLRRRIPLLILTKLKAEEITQIAYTAANSLGWDTEKTAGEIARLKALS